MHGKLVAQTSEVIHTNKKHPFLTQEDGFVPVGELMPGMHIVRADGSVGVVSQWVVVPGVETMYNLEVAQDHTFTVGDGQWVVHNSNCMRTVEKWNQTAVSLNGTLKNLSSKGYNFSKHFFNEFTINGDGAGLTAESIIGILKNGSHIIASGDDLYSVVGKAGKQYYRIAYDSAGTLHTIFKGGFPERGFEYISRIDFPFD